MTRKRYFQSTRNTVLSVLDGKGLEPLKHIYLQTKQRQLFIQSMNHLFSPQLMSHIKEIEIKNYRVVVLSISGSVWYHGMLRNINTIREQLRQRHHWVDEINLILIK